MFVVWRYLSLPSQSRSISTRSASISPRCITICAGAGTQGAAALLELIRAGVIAPGNGVLKVRPPSL